MNSARASESGSDPPIGSDQKGVLTNKAKQVINHTSGSKSYAQIRREHVENLLLIRFSCTSIIHKK